MAPTEPERGYNGWKNRETWLVTLWLNNKPVSHNMLRAIAMGGYRPDTNDLDGYGARRNRELIYERSKVLREWVSNCGRDILEIPQKHPYINIFQEVDEGMYLDLLMQALDDVDWIEIVENVEE